MENPLIALSIELAATAERAGRSVVAVNARWRNSSSGVIWRNGVIVTADHTIRREDEIRVTLPDGRTAAAELAGRDPGTDLAVLKVDTAEGPVARAAAPDSVKTGNLALAIGRSEQTGVSAAMGVVSNASGPWHTWRGGKLDRFLRLDIGLYPGVSGAAVVDAEGQADRYRDRRFVANIAAGNPRRNHRSRYRRTASPGTYRARLSRSRFTTDRLARASEN